MTPKEKAQELVIKLLRKYCPDEGDVIIYDHTIVTSKNQFDIGYFVNCALVIVNEVLNEYMFDDSAYSNRRYKYWQEVKQEIEKL